MTNGPYHPCDASHVPAVTDTLIGAIVVNTNDVGFYVFRTHSTEVLKSHKVPVENMWTAQGGRMEQDPVAVLQAVRECINNTVSSPLGRVAGVPVRAVGLANHRCTVVAWNRNTGVPLSNAVLWSDYRAAETVDRYLRRYKSDRFQHVCGLPMSPYFSAFKIRWLLDNEQKVRDAFRKGSCVFGTLDTWIVWNLTGGVKGGKFFTDTTNASHTFLMNIHTLDWDPELLELFGIPRRCLPVIKGSCAVYGKFYEGPLADTTTISCVMGNRQAALVGHRCFRNGMTKVSLDAGANVLTVTGDRRVFSKHGMLTTIGYHLDTIPVFALEGPIASAGMTVDWMKKHFTVHDSECFKSGTLAKKGEHLYFVPAFKGLYAPHWRHDARSCFYGADYSSSSEDVLKAAMESVGFQLQEAVAGIDAEMKMSTDKVRLDCQPGHHHHPFVLQHVADALQAQVSVAMTKDIAALGAAMGAGYTREVNVWRPFCMAEEHGKCYSPRMRVDERNARISEWKRAVNRSCDWAKSEYKYSNFWLSLPLVVPAVVAGAYMAYKRFGNLLFR